MAIGRTQMLPLGVLAMGRRKTRLTAAEQTTLLTLWSIARSPLIMGGDLRKLDDFTLSLLTNDEVLGVNQSSEDNREIFRGDGLAAWQARPTRGGGTYLAVFNLRDATPASAGATLPIQLADLGLSGPVRVRDLWRRADVETVRGILCRKFPAMERSCFGCRRCSVRVGRCLQRAGTVLPVAIIAHMAALQRLMSYGHRH